MKAALSKSQENGEGRSWRTPSRATAAAPWKTTCSNGTANRRRARRAASRRCLAELDAEKQFKDTVTELVEDRRQHRHRAWRHQRLSLPGVQGEAPRPLLQHGDLREHAHQRCRGPELPGPSSRSCTRSRRSSPSAASSRSSSTCAITVSAAISSPAARRSTTHGTALRTIATPISRY